LDATARLQNCKRIPGQFGRQPAILRPRDFQCRTPLRRNSLPPRRAGLRSNGSNKPISIFGLVVRGRLPPVLLAQFGSHRPFAVVVLTGPIAIPGVASGPAGRTASTGRLRSSVRDAAGCSDHLLSQVCSRPPTGKSCRFGLDRIPSARYSPRPGRTVAAGGAFTDWARVSCYGGQRSSAGC
jgi:hypothetical protein